MSNFFDGVWKALTHPVDEAKFIWKEGIEDVGKNLIRGDFSQAWDEVKQIPGEHQRMMNKITVPIFGDNKLSKNSDALVGAAIGSVVAAPYVASAFGGGSGSSALEAYQAAGGLNGKKPTGGAPVFELGEVGDGLDMGPFQSDDFSVGKGTDWGGIMKSVGDALSKMEEGKQVSHNSHRPGFRGAQIPAGSFDTGALQNDLAAREFQQQVGPNQGNKKINDMLGLG